MSIENYIISGNYNKVIENLDKLDRGHLNSVFLLSVIYEKQDIACKIFELKNSLLEKNILEEVFRSAAAHDEAKIVAMILNEMHGKIDKELLIDALQMSATKGYSDTFEALKLHPCFKDVINQEDDDNPHIITLATEYNHPWFIERILELPEIHVEHHHAAYAEMKKRFEISEIFKMAISRRKEFKVRDQKEAFIEEDKRKSFLVGSHMGPHMKVEVEKRLRKEKKIWK